MTRGEYLNELSTWSMFLMLSGGLSAEQYVCGRPMWAAGFVAASVVHLGLATFIYFDPKCRAEDTRL
jgi:hypothetical protein